MEYIQEMREMLYNLQNRIQKAKQNVEGITQAMQVRGLPGARGRGPWCQGPCRGLQRGLLCDWWPENPSTQCSV